MRFMVVLIVVLGAGCQRAKPPEPPRSIEQKFGDVGFLTLRDPGTGLGLKAGGQMDLRAATCGGCHQKIYAEWQQSTHAAALRDPQLLAELSKPSNPRWLCLNCHIPLQNQRPYLVKSSSVVRGLTLDERPNPSYDPKLAAEAITCATCHVRPGLDGRGVVLGPRGGADSPHLVRRDPEALRGVCVDCHDPGGVTISPTLTCWFRTHEELKGGPGAKQGCVDCHMPLTERSVAVGSPVRANTRHHYWAGGGVPKSFAAYDTLLSRDYRPAVEVTVRAVRVAEDRTTVQIELRNTRGGHTVPTADPERFLLVEALLYDAQGEQVSRRTAHLGQHWDYGDAASGRSAKMLSDNRLRPGERRTLTLALPATGAKLVVQVKHVRLSPTNAAYTRQAKIPAEVRALAPESAAKISQLTAHYPLFTYVFAERRDLETGAVVREDLPTLLRRSKEAAGWSMARLKRALADEAP